MKKLNNKGYLLVEIVVAFSLAMAILYLAANLSIKVKNKNDELMIRALTMTDQTLIYNLLMKEKKAGVSLSCSVVDVANKKVSSSGKIIILNEYVSSISCNFNSLTKIITITITPKLLDETFKVVIPQ